MIVKVRVDGLAQRYGFTGIIEDPDNSLCGKRAFFNSGVPGELVSVEILKQKKNFISGRLIDVLEASSDRVEPRCGLEGLCGGCGLQHLDIKHQRELKRAFLENSINNRLKPAEPVSVGLLGAELPGFGCRNRVTFQVDASGQIGFFEKETHTVVPVSNCPVAVTEINDLLQQLSALPRELIRQFSQIRVEVSSENTTLEFKPKKRRVSLEGARGSISQVLCGFSSIVTSSRIRFFSADSNNTAGSFSQVNAEANKVLIDKIMDLGNQPPSPQGYGAPGRELIEYYAGGGNFTIPLARNGCKVTAIELDPELVKAGQRKAKQEGLEERVSFIQSKTEDSLSLASDYECVLLDPPRTGAKELAKVLSAENQKQVIYVSCSVPTLIRDLEYMQANGLKLTEAYCLDMFPQTPHLESLCVLCG